MILLIVTENTLQNYRNQNTYHSLYNPYWNWFHSNILTFVFWLVFLEPQDKIYKNNIYIHLVSNVDQSMPEVSLAAHLPKLPKAETPIFCQNSELFTHNFNAPNNLRTHTFFNIHHLHTRTVNFLSFNLCYLTQFTNIYNTKLKNKIPLICLKILQSFPKLLLST